MKVLLTGANGFVGSHILDRLLARSIPTVALLRPSSDRRFIEPQLPQVQVRIGSVGDPSSLTAALQGVTHVIHCAGCTKSVRIAAFDEINRLGTRNLVAAINQRSDPIARLVHISSLAAGRPALPDRPAREEEPSDPRSEYGRSKLAGEQEIREACKADYVILRPSAVYGPRDGDFLQMFKSVRAHLVPRVGGGRQPLSLVFVRDLAEAAVACLDRPAATRRTYYVAAPEVVTAAALTDQIAAQMKTWTASIPLPRAVLWSVCLLRDAVSKLTRKSNILSLQKYPELTAPGWVCDPTRLRQELGFSCSTNLERGIAETLAWYRQQGWL